MLGNFTYYNPTKLHFGKDALNKLNDELPHYGNNVLLIYGGGSIKRTGLYDKVVAILKDNGKNIFEDDGVMPNPTTDKLAEGIERARAGHVDFILAVGGGSVIDYAKALSVSVHCQEDPWEKYYIRSEDVNNEIVPIGCILTMVGTGSEMNGGSVITNHHANLKIGHVFGANVFPKFAILNPELTFTVPQYQMVAGIFDIMSHLLEQYFSGTDDNTSDYIIEGLLKSLIYSARIAVKDPKDYEARSNIMWTSTWALNTLCNKGKSEDWMVHMIGHAIGALTNATHGMTLAAVSIPYYHLILKDGLPKFKRYATHVWDVSADAKSDEQIALEGLDRMASFMREIGLVLNAKELGVKDDMLGAIADATFILKDGYRVLTRDEIINIIKDSMNDAI